MRGRVRPGAARSKEGQNYKSASAGLPPFQNLVAGNIADTPVASLELALSSCRVPRAAVSGGTPKLFVYSFLVTPHFPSSAVIFASCRANRSAYCASSISRIALTCAAICSSTAFLTSSGTSTSSLTAGISGGGAASASGSGSGSGSASLPSMSG